MLVHSAVVAICFATAAVAGAQPQTYERYPFRTLAGNPIAVGGTDGPADAARFFHPTAIAFDLDGNLFVADTLNHTIRKIDPDGRVSTIAGRAAAEGFEDGIGSEARFSLPRGVAADANGNVFVADNMCTIRKITPEGVVSTFAGAPWQFGAEDGPGKSARFVEVKGLATDAANNVYVLDGFKIRKITPDAVVTTLAGSGTSGHSDGAGASAAFNFPEALVADAAGNLYVADTTNAAIRKVTPNGVVTTLAGSRFRPGSADGPGSTASFSSPMGIAFGPDGNLYVSDYYNYTIRRVTLEGVVSTVAGETGESGSDEGPTTFARFSGPRGVAVDSSGTIYIADYSNNSIRQVSTAGVVSTFAGPGGSIGRSDGLGRAARFYYPSGITCDANGTIHVSDASNHTIRRITAAGNVTTLAGSAGEVGDADGNGSAARFNTPAGLTVDQAGNVYVADYLNQTIRKITSDGVVSTVAGLSGTTGHADGSGNQALFNRPNAVAIDEHGTLFVADSGNNVIRAISPGGVVSTFVGNPEEEGTADGAAQEARFRYPTGLAIDPLGNLFVADTGNQLIRKVTPDGSVSTVAGAHDNRPDLPGSGGNRDGVGSEARFNHPSGIALDGAGNIFVADKVNHSIRKITPAQVVTTIGGAPTPGSADGAGGAARFSIPSGVAVDPTGRLLVVDSGNSTIRVGGPVPLAQPLNISTRLRVQTGEAVMIAGFIMSGDQGKSGVVRALGPSLAAGGVADTLNDPVLEVYDADGYIVARNENWRDDELTAEDLQTAGLAPSDEREAAVFVWMGESQSYTAVVRGAANTGGVALVEVYDMMPQAGSVLANISTRGFVGAGDDALIGGFILGGSGAQTRVAVRALGPSLQSSGIASVLLDPTLRLHDGSGAVIAANDNWKDSDEAALLASGLAPADDAESALLATLPAGTYTAVVSGNEGGTGVGLVEVYNLD